MFGGMRQFLLGVHIFLAIIWVGGVLFVGWGVYPAAKSMAYEVQRKFFLSLMSWTHRMFTAAGSGVILTGVLLGTVAGPIRHWDDIWHTEYGNIWFSALIIGLFTLLWGVFVGYRKSTQIFSKTFLWKIAENGNKQPLTHALASLVVIESIEVVGFLTLIVLMISF